MSRKVNYKHFHDLTSTTLLKEYESPSYFETEFDDSPLNDDNKNVIQIN